MTRCGTKKICRTWATSCEPKLSGRCVVTGIFTIQYDWPIVEIFFRAMEKAMPNKVKYTRRDGTLVWVTEKQRDNYKRRSRETASAGRSKKSPRPETTKGSPQKKQTPDSAGRSKRDGTRVWSRSISISPKLMRNGKTFTIPPNEFNKIVAWYKERWREASGDFHSVKLKNVNHGRLGVVVELGSKQDEVWIDYIRDPDEDGNFPVIIDGKDYLVWAKT